MCSAHELAPGSVVPDLIEANLPPSRAALRQAIRDTLGSVWRTVPRM